MLRGEFHHIRSKISKLFFCFQSNLEDLTNPPTKFFGFRTIRTPPKLRYNLSKNAIFWQKNEKNKNSSKVPYTFWRIIQQIILALERLKPPQKRWICNKWHFIPKKYIFLASIFVVSFYEARRRYNIRRSKVTYRIWKIYPQIILALGRSEHPQNRGIIYHKMRFIGKKKKMKKKS